MIDKNAADYLKLVKDGITLAHGILMGGAVLGGLGIGYGAAKLTSPTSIAENSDKELEQEALQTEIDVTQRRIAALEERRKNRKAQVAPKVYDRFV